MFWRFGGYSNISTIDTLLDKQNVKLEDLLEESDLIQELKSHHTKLIEFLRDDNNLHSLLKYVVAPGPPVSEDDESDEHEEPKVDEEKEKAEKQRLKFAYVACEILSCETWSITESLMANTQYLTEFWEFLRRPPPLDPLQAGYFTKVNETLLEKKTEEMLDFFKSLPDIVPAMLQHVDCPMVMDLLLKIISLEKADGGAGIVDWLHDKDLVPTLLSHLSPESNSSTQTSAGDFLKAIITISANAAQNEQSCIGPNSLTRQLVSEACVEKLISSMLKGGNPLTVGVGIVIEVIRKNNSDYDPEGQSPDAPPTNHDPIFLGTLLRRFADHVPDFMHLILSSKRTITDGENTKVVERGTLKSAWGTSIEPLGFDRFKTCELMAELLHCSNMGLLNEKGSEEYIEAKDAERERMRAAGAFSNNKQGEESIAETSTSSSRFETGFTPSASASSEELRVANGGEEDGFEKITVQSMPATRSTEAKNVPSTSEGFVVEPPAPLRTHKSIEGKSTGQDLDENVRRLSLEDTEMTSPPAAESEGSGYVQAKGKSGDTSPHPEDRPAPLFSKAKDPHKTPTPSSPEGPRSPGSSGLFADSGITSQLEGDSSMQTRDETMQESGIDANEDKPVVGDYLKIMFVENQVVPTILSFFFRFPWNNFLHNVVYDVVQQVFNGPMDRGHNRFLAFDLFESGKVTEQIIQGQARSDEAQQQKSMRLGYMGHLTLVAEEVVKFGERHPKEVLSPVVQDYIYGKPWEEYVTKTLAETRERDNAILGGFRPESGLGPRQAVLNAVNSGGFTGSNALANAGLTGGQQGLDTVDLSNNGSTTSAAYNSGSSALSGFGSSSDDEDEEMDDADDADRHRSVIQLATADTGPPPEGSDQPVPLIPPPPAPLNIEPSRARRRLAERLTMHRAQQQQQVEQEMAASEFGLESDDPFAALGDNDDQDAEEPFSLDEEEQDITAFGKRSNANGFNTSPDKPAFSVSRGISNLFSTGHRAHRSGDDFDGSMDDSSSSDSGSDIDPEHPPLEARTSLERRPLDVDDDDEEMGEMVAPTDEANSSDEEELTADEKARLGIRSSDDDDDDDDGGSEFSGQDDQENDDGEALVEIAMPRTKRRSRGSIS